MTKYMPNESCSMCRGTGEVVDWVPYGSTNVPMYSVCECVERQVEDEDDDVEIVLPPVRIKGGKHE